MRFPRGHHVTSCLKSDCSYTEHATIAWSDCAVQLYVIIIIVVIVMVIVIMVVIIITHVLLRWSSFLSKRVGYRHQTAFLNHKRKASRS